MTKRDKLKVKFCRKPPPKDFRFDELVTMLSNMGFTMHELTGGSSHKCFILTLDSGEEHRLFTVKPHPNNTLKTYQIKDILSKLEEWDLI